MGVFSPTRFTETADYSVKWEETLFEKSATFNGGVDTLVIDSVT